jgi:hypothetical protein
LGCFNPNGDFCRSSLDLVLLDRKCHAAMMGGLVREPSPEEQELQKKKAELAELESCLADRELEWATFQAELHAFEHRHRQMVEIRQRELHQIKAQIEEYSAYLASAHQFETTGELKQVYRQLAKSIHPDYAADPEERIQREKLMAQVNQAYERGDIEQLKALLQDWSNCPESVQGSDLGAELMRVLRKIAQNKQRLATIEQQMQDLEQKTIFQLQLKAKRFQQIGIDLLVEQARELDKQIRAAQQHLDAVKNASGVGQ